MTSADLLVTLGKAGAGPATWAELVDRHGVRLWAVGCAAAGPALADPSTQ